MSPAYFQEDCSLTFDFSGNHDARSRIDHIAKLLLHYLSDVLLSEVEVQERFADCVEMAKANRLRINDVLARLLKTACGYPGVVCHGMMRDMEGTGNQEMEMEMK